MSGSVRNAGMPECRMRRGLRTVHGTVRHGTARMVASDAVMPGIGLYLPSSPVRACAQPFMMQ